MSDSQRKKLLDEAAKCVLQDRNNSYGSPEKSFEVIARLWSEVLGVKVTPHQVALCMVQLKVARLISNPSHWDSKVDGAGYFACMAEFDARPAAVVAVPSTPLSISMPPTYTLQENGGKHLFKPQAELPSGGISIIEWLKHISIEGETIRLLFSNGKVEVLKVEGSGWRRVSSSIKQTDYLITARARYVNEDFEDGMTVQTSSSTYRFHKSPVPHFVRQ